ncbi:MAG: chemotaxis protein CheW [Alphaproteobacteria bacterium]|nr:chemotaxis protein CheW [Alphaproteobacteria bacterium]
MDTSTSAVIKAEDKEKSRDLLTIVIAGQRFGIPILQVQDVLGEQKVTKIPLAPPEVAGALNLRGRIVTAINVRCRLGLERGDVTRANMSVVVEHDNELYSLIIDEIGDVMRLKNKDFKPTPGTLDPVWREISSGVYRLDGEILVVLDVPRFLGTIHN